MPDPTAERALRDETTALLRELIRVDTSNPPGRETPAALLLRDYLERSGVECELVARKPERANLVARIRGSGDGPSLALLGHTDVVPADPAASLSLDRDLLERFPVGYRHLAYAQTRIGFDVKPDMPGLVGPEVDALYARGARWLEGGPAD